MTKRILIMILSVVLIIGMTPLSALAAISKNAQACDDLNLLKGTNNGVTSQYLAEDCLRYQAFIIKARLLGKESEINNMSPNAPNFTDAAGHSTYMKKVMAYAKAHPEIGFNGYNDGSFRPEDRLTAQQLYKVLLVALGNEENTDFAWNQVFSKASDAGLTRFTNVHFITNDDLATAIMEALKAEMADGSQTLADRLIDKNLINQSVAQRLGLTASPKTPGTSGGSGGGGGGSGGSSADRSINVTAVNVIDGNTVEVTFSKAVGLSANIAANFTLSGTAAKSLGNPTTAVIQTDPTKVRLTLTGLTIGTAVGQTIIVTVANVKAGDGYGLGSTKSASTIASYTQVETTIVVGGKTFLIVDTENLEEPYTASIKDANGDTMVTQSDLTWSLENVKADNTTKVAIDTTGLVTITASAVSNDFEVKAATSGAAITGTLAVSLMTYTDLETNAVTEVDELFFGGNAATTTAALAVNVDNVQIDRAQTLVTALKVDFPGKAALQGYVNEAKVLWDADVVGEVDSLFDGVDSTLADGTDQDAIDAASALVDTIYDGTIKTAQALRLAAAQNLLDMAADVAAVAADVALIGDTAEIPFGTYADGNLRAAAATIVVNGKVQNGSTATVTWNAETQLYSLIVVKGAAIGATVTDFEITIAVGPSSFSAAVLSGGTFTVGTASEGAVIAITSIIAAGVPVDATASTLVGNVVVKNGVDTLTEGVGSDYTIDEVVDTITILQSYLDGLGVGSVTITIEYTIGTIMVTQDIILTVQSV